MGNMKSPRMVIAVAVSLAVLAAIGMVLLPEGGMDTPEEKVEKLRIWYMVLGIAHCGSLLLGLAVWIVSLKGRQLLRKKILELIVAVMVVILSSYIFLGATLSFWFRYRTMRP